MIADKRTRMYRQLSNLVIGLTCLLLGALLNKWQMTPTWESKQLKLGTSLLSPVPQNDLVFAREKPQDTPKPTPKPTTVLVQEEIVRVFGENTIMLKVAKCESGFNPKAKNPKSSATGVFQIMSSVHGISPRFLTDYKVNIAAAHKLYLEQNLMPWEASRNCWSN